MGTQLQKYDKKEFINFLKKNKVKQIIINKFIELPETILHSGHTFKLEINVTWYSIGETHYSFESNYYCEDLIEYLFSFKVFTDVEVSINNLLCELKLSLSNRIKRRKKI